VTTKGRELIDLNHNLRLLLDRVEIFWGHELVDEGLAERASLLRCVSDINAHERLFRARLHAIELDLATDALEMDLKFDAQSVRRVLCLQLGHIDFPFKEGTVFLKEVFDGSCVRRDIYISCSVLFPIRVATLEIVFAGEGRI